MPYTYGSAIPVLPVLDIGTALDFYSTYLGAETIIERDNYAGVGLGPVQIHFWLTDDANLPANSSCRIVVQGIDALYARCEAEHIVHPNGALIYRPWGYREFTAMDPFGNALVFAEETGTHKA